MARLVLHWVETADRWRLALYERAVPIATSKPPVLCVHGFAQNHRTWQSGGWDRTLAEAGHPTYLLDLRGHGSSKQRLHSTQQPPIHAAQSTQQPPTHAAQKSPTHSSQEPLERASLEPPRHTSQEPPAHTGLWRIDDYLAQDLPAAVRWLRERHGGAKLILCGHSLGGVLSGLYAAEHPEDVAVLAMLAAPLSPGRTSRRVRLACQSVQTLARWAERRDWRWSWLPLHLFFWGMDQLSFGALPILGVGLPWLAKRDKAQIVSRLWHPQMTQPEAVRSLLRHADPEPMTVVLQMTQWMLTDQVLLGDPPQDQRPRIHGLNVPLLCAWGDEDRLAPPETQAAFVQTLSGPWQRTLALKKTNHMDITAGQPAQKVIEALLDLWNDWSATTAA